MKIRYLILMLLAASVLLTGICGATAGPAITISPPAVTLMSGSSVTYNIRISGLEAGLGGYRMQVKLTNPNAGEITAVSFPDWATGPKATHLPSDNVTISASDLAHKVEDGDSGVTLVSVTVTATGAGTANIKLLNLTMQDDHSGTFQPDLATAKLTSQGGNESVSQPVAIPTSVVPSVTLPTGTNTSVNRSFQTAIPTLLRTTSPPVSPEVTTFPVSAAANIPEQKDSLPQVPFYQRIPRMALVGFGLVALIAAIGLLYLGTTRKI
jgi:hypothetical protein